MIPSIHGIGHEVRAPKAKRVAPRKLQHGGRGGDLPLSGKHKIAVFGSTGQLGTDLVEVLRQEARFDVVPLSHGDADCTKADAVSRVVLKLRPHTVINCAAFVRVDDCEDQANLAFDVNAIGAFNVARACAAIDAHCVYISTDYVFDGMKENAYVESDQTSPINVYGVSKLAGEHLVRQTVPRWLIVRVSSLFGKTGARGKGGNFIETILAKAKKGDPLKIVDDIRISPTYTWDAAHVLRHLLENDVTGVVHAANGGSCTWCEFARQVLKLTDIDVSLEPILSNEYPAKARRPANSALISQRSPELFHKTPRTWQQALKDYLEKKGHIRH
jgi:dTDP-4-dehydrorhamnose reductase